MGVSETLTSTTFVKAGFFPWFPPLAGKTAERK
jgi:hypothetical protein